MRKTHHRKGFTLIELLVVLLIIGLLATIASAALGAARQKARTTKAQAELKAISEAVEMLSIDTGEWPAHQPVDTVCVTCSNNELQDLSIGAAGLVTTDGNYAGWKGPYMEKMPLDPWGTPYFFDTDYDVSGQMKAVVGSYGPNGVGLNLYDSDDILFILAP